MTVVKQLWDNVYLRFVMIALSLGLAYLFFSLTRDVWIALVVSYLLAYLLNPLVSWVERKTNRVVGMLALLVALVLLLVFVGLRKRVFGKVQHQRTASSHHSDKPEQASEITLFTQRQKFS
jgi:predicted PurR-regulated permease PerM